MIAIRERHGKDADRRFAEPPWDERTPRWQEIDHNLPAGHLARQIDEVVEELDLAGLFATYSGRGSKALWPDLLLRLVLYEMQHGRLSPAEWFLDARENEPASGCSLACNPPERPCTNSGSPSRLLGRLERGGTAERKNWDWRWEIAWHWTER